MITTIKTQYLTSNSNLMHSLIFNKDNNEDIPTDNSQSLANIKPKINFFSEFDEQSKSN